jgi:hypothetical protein
MKNARSPFSLTYTSPGGAEYEYDGHLIGRLTPIVHLIGCGLERQTSTLRDVRIS